MLGTMKNGGAMTAVRYSCGFVLARSAVVALAVAVAACSQSPAPTAQAPAAKAAPDFATWDANGGGAESSQYTSLPQIDKSNVGRLAVAWTYAFGETTRPDGTKVSDNYLFNPIVVGKVMYVLAKSRSIVALDAATGAEIWTHANEGAVGTRGLNYWKSKDGADERLLYLNGGFLTAIDAKTGNTVATFGENGRVDLRIGLEDPSSVRALQTNNPGRIFDDLIIMSLPAGGAGYASAPADIHAYNVVTGKLTWVFHTVPRAGEPGSETWPEAGLGHYGGVHNWSESTVDVETGTIYIPTGTARFDFYGANREGQNLYANSLLALDARSGKLLWHFQAIHHDLWDYDFPTAPKLMTVMQDGMSIPAIAQPSKQGFLYVFNRITGVPLWPIEERPVPQSDVPGEHSWPTQPFPTAPPPFARQKFTEADINPYLPPEDQEQVRELLRNSRNEGLFTPPSLKGTIMAPGHNGGANWGSSAADPIRGRLFVVSKELPTFAKLREPQTVPGAGGPPGGGGGGGPGGGNRPPPVPPPNAGPDFVPYSSPVDFMIRGNGLSAFSPPWSQLTAYDLNTGKIMWQIPDGDVSATSFAATGTGSHAPRGGVVATGTGLLFVGTSSDRKFRAYDADNGKVLWQYDLPAAQEGVPAVYSVDGREYVAVAVGGNGLFSQGLKYPTEAGPGQYMVFALGETQR
ncbi:MAG TPA: PQQ-binding-like beta-propeller repeat protein [Gammaproteobacteria bacterium]|nr:PQQ-binding-like beta-propeller repeat protein [Gammaproteobacteria bacterium]